MFEYSAYPPFCSFSLLDCLRPRMKSIACFSFWLSLAFISAQSFLYWSYSLTVSSSDCFLIYINILNFLSTSFEAPVFWVKIIFHPLTLLDVSYLCVIKYLSTKGEYLRHSYWRFDLTAAFLPISANEILSGTSSVLVLDFWSAQCFHLAV